MKILLNPLDLKQLRRLTEHFSRKFFDSENFATPHSDMHLLFVQILALLVIPGFFKTFGVIYKYSNLAWSPVAVRDQAVLVDTYSFLVISMLLTGFITVFEWDALFPDDKDLHNLAPLPIRSITLFSSKMITLLIFVTLANIAINGLSTLLFPSIVLSASQEPGTAGWQIPLYDLLAYTQGHAISLFLGSVFVFTSMIAIRALLILFLPVRLLHTASRYAQLALILIILCAFLVEVQPDRLITENSSLIYWMPSFWFLGLHQMIIGHYGVNVGTLAKYAYTAVLLSFGVSILGYTVSYWVSMQKGCQSSGAASRRVSGIRKKCAWILRKTILRGSFERAFFHFIAQTVFRRREHFLYCGSFAMVGVALIIAMGSNISHDPHQHLHMFLSFPLVLSFLILVGMRYAFSVPADLNANWTFKIINRRKLEKSYGGIQKFMFCAANIPLFLVFAPCYMFILDFRLLVMHVLFASVLSLILIKILLFRFNKLPFTSTYIPGKANLKAFWLPYLLSFAIYSFGTTALELWLVQDIGAYITFMLFAGAVIIGLSIFRSSFLKESNAVQFEAEPDQAMNVLTIEG